MTIQINYTLKDEFEEILIGREIEYERETFADILNKAYDKGYEPICKIELPETTRIILRKIKKEN